MRSRQVAVVGAAETRELGVMPGVSNLQLNADAAIAAVADCGLKPSDIDGLACGYLNPADLAHYLGLYPTWIDGTSVGGCSWMLMVRHAVAALQSGLCKTVLVVHGESGRSRVAGPFYHHAEADSLAAQFDNPYGWTGIGAVGMFTLPVVRYMKEFGLTEEDLANVVVAQREWALGNPRAGRQEGISVDEVLSSPMVAYPFRKPMCCLVSDGGGAMVLTLAERAKDFPTRPVYVLGTGEAVESHVCGIASVRDPLRPEFVRVSADLAFTEAGIAREEVDHLMIYDAFAHNPIYGLEGMGFLNYGEAGPFISEGNTHPGGRLPVNTNGGGLSYAHTGSYGMLAMQESLRQLRGEAFRQVPDVHISACHGWGGFFSVCSTIIFGNECP